MAYSRPDSVQAGFARHDSGIGLVGGTGGTAALSAGRRRHRLDGVLVPDRAARPVSRTAKLGGAERGVTVWESRIALHLLYPARRGPARGLIIRERVTRPRRLTATGPDASASQRKP